MEIVPYDCNHAEHEYKCYYSQQGGGSVPIYAGAKYQQGYGIGSIFGSLLKSALPIIKRGAKSLGKTAIKTGLNVVKDGLSGKNIKQSLKTNLKRAGTEILTNSINNIPSMNSMPNRQNKKRKHPSGSISLKTTAKNKRRKKSRNSDIFS